MHTLGLVLGMGGETLRDKFRLTNTAMITGTVSDCFTFSEEDSPMLLRLASSYYPPGSQVSGTIGHSPICS